MPELPAAVRARYAALGLSQYDVLVLADELAVCRYFDAVLAAGAPPKPAANWVMGDVMAAAKELAGGFDALPMAPAALAEMIALIEDGTISGKIGKQASLLGGCGRVWVGVGWRYYVPSTCLQVRVEYEQPCSVGARFHLVALTRLQGRLSSWPLSGTALSYWDP